jgi:amino acid transporter
MSSLFFLLSFIVVNGSVIKLRRERPNMRRPYEMPYYPIPAVLGIVLNLVLTGVLVVYLVQTDLLALGLSAAWMALGVGAYYGLRRYRTSSETSQRAQGDEQPSGSAETLEAEDD